jgi:hypothetical protein
MNEGSTKQQIVEAIKSNSNILVTVSDSPSVDELSAALGLTILLNKLEKRATSIFSGAIPPAITFLDPEKTLEGTVDSLRDFIIALDKEKADHLRYKVDGDVVKIFITPYRTTLNEKDLQFSQGDYNVELVIALGVKDQEHLDKALEAHGRILHDATVATISTDADPSQLGSIDWRDAAASSLCEMLVSLSDALKDEQPILDEQTSTAFLTGIVSATDRFSNDHTSSRVMTMAAQLMAAGANQQLIAAKLQEAHDIGPDSVPKDAKSDNADGTTTISEDKSTKGEKDHKKADKKPKKDDNSLRIDRDVKKDEVDAEQANEENSTAAADQDVATLVATEEALQQAEPAKDVEKELADQLGELTAPQPSVDINQELENAIAEPTPEISPAIPAISDGMPGFESLEVPPKAATIQPPSEPIDDQTTDGFIDSHPGSSYVANDAPASFDAPVDGIIGGTGGTSDGGSVDPFSVPLAPLPDLHESKEMDVPENSEPAPQPAPFVFDDAAAPTPALDMPPLPPLPDFSTLPPLPAPPAPPVFDQPSIPMPTQSGAISADKLGDIFGDAPTQAPDTPPPSDIPPPPPGQFKIPGQ